MFHGIYFLANKWIFLNEIALPNSLNSNDTLLISELMEKPLEVLIAILHGLNDTFVTHATPSLIAGYRFKLTTQCLKVALINWGDFQECGGILTWTGEDDITCIDNVEIQEKFSDFHNYCHGRQQQTDILHREARENAIELQNAMVDLDNIIPDMPMAMDSSIFLSENDPQEENINSSMDNSSEAIDVTTINNSAPAENSDFKLIKSSKGRDKLSYSGYIFNFQRESNGKQQWRCQIKNCKGRIHTIATSILKIIGQNCHGEEIDKEEVLEFRAGVNF